MKIRLLSSACNDLARGWILFGFSRNRRILPA